MNVLYRQCSL